MKKYSFLMSIYYKEKPEYLKLSINSMLSQTVKPDEIVIVKDGKLTEELDEVIEEYRMKNSGTFTIVELEKNIGLGLALNEGLKVARNELIARMDGDDISKPTRCEEELMLFETSDDIDIVGTFIDEFIDDPTNIVSRRIVPTQNDDIYKFAKRRSPFNHPTVMYKKSTVLKNNGYSDLRRNQDVDLFGRMLYNGAKAANINKPLLLFRTNNDLLKRRRNWENTKLYIRVIYSFWKMGFSSFSDLFVVTVGQMIMFIVPLKLQRFLYNKILRKE